MIRNTRIRAFFAVLLLGAAASACMDGAPGPMDPSRPVGSLIGTTLEVVDYTTETVVGVVEATIGVAGGTLAIPGGHSLHFPAGALAEATTIRASKDGNRLQIEFGPHGLVFPDSAQPTLTLSYVDGTGLTDADADRIFIVYLGDDGSVQEVLQTTVDTAGDVARARLRHFSTYAIATD